MMGKFKKFEFIYKWGINMKKNIFEHKSTVTRKEREKRAKHKSKVLWFTGLSGSGKSTIATELEKKIYGLGISTFILDGDNVRFGLNGDLGFTDKDRMENMRRLSEVSKLFLDANVLTMVAAISPFEKEREKVRKKFQEGDFVEIYIKCPIEECEKRDPKGLYKKVRNGEIKNFTGIDSPYEEPRNPEITLETDKMTVEEMTNEIIAYLKDNKVMGVDNE